MLPFDYNNNEHQSVLQLLIYAAKSAGEEICKNGILRPRPNEIGNDVEKYVRNELEKLGLKPQIPLTNMGKKKTTGYPDIIFFYNGFPYYLECKTYNLKNISSSQRSFYFSPSKEFKINHDTIHFLLSYEMFVAGEQNGKHIYKCKHFKIFSLEKLLLDLKYEFNSDNNRLYSNKHGTKLLYEESI